MVPFSRSAGRRAPSLSRHLIILRSTIGALVRKITAGNWVLNVSSCFTRAGVRRDCCGVPGVREKC